MNVFDKELYVEKLTAFYKEHYGENDADILYEQPAVNVWMFRRGEDVITLKSHLLTGEVDVFTERMV